ALVSIPYKVVKAPQLFGNSETLFFAKILSLTRGHARERIGRFCFGTRSIAEVKTKAKRLGVPAPSRLKEG
uniref:hypothetical protein n=1 Tax=uncultured Parasutterella sp. TaxID=1263098 RepID=UPI00258A3A6A